MMCICTVYVVDSLQEPLVDVRCSCYRSCGGAVDVDDTMMMMMCDE